ncbi:SpoIIE family protein phosphatase [Spirillospora sp. CA-142024]|uniref:SpoIIE family protein phosphatase n=1 Tax=Spirillospora sp. CA-142024 TaxID=3240036 RepID=UPI003D8EABBA
MATPERNDLIGQRAPFDVADAATVLLDAQGVVTSWSRRAADLLGHPAANVLGRQVTSLLAPADAARVGAVAERCRAVGSWSGLLSARHRDGRSVGVEVHVIPLKDAQGHMIWLILGVDAASSAGSAMERSVLLERMVTQSPVGLAVLDTELRYVWSNPALEQFGGGTAEQRRGQRLEEIQPGVDSEMLTALMRQVLETGAPVLDYEFLGRIRSLPDQERAFSMDFMRLDDENGRPLGVCYFVVDVTDRYRSKQRLSLLDRASEHIGRSLDVMQTAQDLADVVVPDLAEFVAVDLLESVLRGAEPVPGPAGDADTVPLYRAGQQSIHSGVPEAVVAVGSMAHYHAWSPPIHCLTSGTSWRSPELDPLAMEWAADLAEGRASRFGELDLHTSMVVPIRARGITLGIATFFRLHAEPFEEEDLRLAEDTVARAAVCIDNARRYTRERDAALTLQRNLLPWHIPEQDAVEVASCYLPADELTGVGGDWFDVIPLSGARVALVVGEVVGHGIDAAATMGRVRAAVQTLADLDFHPEEVLAYLDDLVGRAMRKEPTGPSADGPSAKGTSCLYIVYDPVSRHCSMASAGHPAPATVAPDGIVTFPDLPIGPALGVGGPPFEAIGLELEEGSMLALYTDGLLAAGDEGPDRERLRPLLEGSHLRLDGLCQAVVGGLAPARPHDDVVLLLIRTRTLAAERVASWDLPADPAVVAHARERVSRQLGAWGLEKLAFTTELVVSELVTNAIRHATAPIRLRLILTGTLICEVFDGSSTSPHLRHARATDEGGRGLYLISQFTDRWGARYATEGKIIWAEQRLTADGSDPQTEAKTAPATPTGTAP